MHKIVDRLSRASESILVTGATGCVGRYVVDELLESTPYGVVALTRNARDIHRSLQNSARVTIVEGDLREGARLIARLPSINRAILAATSWEDGESSRTVNVDGHVTCARALVKRGVQRIVWFGTASILDRDGSPLGRAEHIGTPYIASKALARRQLLDAVGDVLSIVHPTLVVGGSDESPWSHIARLFPEIERRAWLARMVTGEGSFHFVHARDLAVLSRELITSAPNERVSEVIGGAPPATLREVLDLVLERRGARRLAELDLTPRRVAWLVALFRMTLAPWDQYCLARRHFVYEGARLTLSPDRRPYYPTVRAIVASLPRTILASAAGER